MAESSSSAYMTDTQLSRVKRIPGIPLAQELEQGLVLVGHIEHHEPLARDAEHMNPHAGVEDPACRRVLETLAFVVRQGGRMALRAVRIRSSRAAYTSTHTVLTMSRALRRAGLLREREDPQKRRLFPEAQPACRPGWPCGAGEHRWRGPRGFVQCVRGEENTAGLVHTRLAVREPGRQGAGDMGDDLVGLGARARAPPRAILGRGGDGTVSEKRGRPVVGTTRQGQLASAAQAKAVRHSVLQALTAAARCVSPCVATGRWAGGGAARRGCASSVAQRPQSSMAPRESDNPL